MADEKVGVVEKPVVKEFVSKEEFDGLKKEVSSGFATIVNLIKEKPKTPEETKKVEAKKAEDKSAQANNAYLEPVHPEWLADAKAKIGEALDHCEVIYPKNGSPIYTIFIKKEFSNASSSHMDFYKSDKRSISVVNGFETVKYYNSLVAQNLRLNAKKVE